MAVRRHGLMEATRSRGSDDIEQIWGGAMASGKHGGSWAHRRSRRKGSSGDAGRHDNGRFETGIDMLAGDGLK
ncbi:hypothetical protein M0R45_008561 [Rubus argutus]|uniref:DBY n=1 Tax=Rubus argutus TaxID=59490 RepID=A0AAW1Y2E1_RUBAR